MVTKRSPLVAHSATNKASRSDIVRQRISVALLRAVSVQGATNAQAARWLKISPRTMFAWVHCETAINVETVLACPQLADAFRVELCIHDHGPGSAAYVAKKRRGAK